MESWTRPNSTVAKATRLSALWPAALFVAVWLVWVMLATAGIS